MASNASQPEEQSIQLKDPFIAGVLAWLIPGLGHFYQGRNAKGALFTICILGHSSTGSTLAAAGRMDGAGLSTFPSARNDWRLPWLCQIGVGLPTVPMTLLQANLEKPIFNGFMAPPPMPNPEPMGTLDNGPPGRRPAPDEMNLAWINRLLPHYYELGTVYTMIAGLLNILAVYDACCGPVPAESAKKGDERPKAKQDDDDEDSEEDE